MIYKIGLIADVHGNEEALKHVLNLLDGNVNEIICLGDLIGIGPNGNEVLEIVSKLKNFSCVLGNHDRYYLYGFNNPGSCTSTYHQNWIKEQISNENGAYLKNLPLYIERTYNNKKIVFIHYGRKSMDNLRFKPIIHNPTYNDLENIFEFTDSDYYFYGHEHIPSIVKGKKTYVCVGSLGCPCPNMDEGRYGILTISDDIKYDTYTFTYDSSKIVNDMERKKMPQREFIRKNFFRK